MKGCTLKSEWSLLVTVKLTVCPDSFGPGEMLVTKFVPPEKGPESSSTIGA